MTIGYGSHNTVEEAEKRIRELPFRFGDGDDWLRVGPLKIFVDGGILYGTRLWSAGKWSTTLPGGEPGPIAGQRTI